MNGAVVSAYSLSHDGNKKIAKNFKVKEFRCKDGTDIIFISDELVEVLQDVRDHFNCPVNLNSGYRTPPHNKKIGGSANSRHQYGMAADFWVKGVDASIVQEYLESKYPDKYGIGKAKNYTHIDVRATKSRWTY